MLSSKFKHNVHCYTHGLNLILVNACTYKKNNEIVFDIFGVVVQLTYLLKEVLYAYTSCSFGTNIS